MDKNDLECCYLFPSAECPQGDLKTPCTEPGEWAIWEEGTHPVEVTNACSGHVGLLLGTTGGQMRFQVWPSKFDEEVMKEPSGQ